MTAARLLALADTAERLAKEIPPRKGRDTTPETKPWEDGVYGLWMACYGPQQQSPMDPDLKSALMPDEVQPVHEHLFQVMWNAVGHHNHKWERAAGYLQGVAAVFRAAAARLEPPSAPVQPTTLDLSFIADTALRGVLEQMARELAVAEAHRLHTTGIVLAGAIGEGVLYQALVTRKQAAVAAAKAPTKHDLEKGQWSLRDYIAVAEEIGLVTPSIAKMAHEVLRGFRNLIHPKLQADSKLLPDEHEMKASVVWLGAVIRDVRKSLGPPPSAQSASGGP
jgi:hypothetical protein